MTQAQALKIMKSGANVFLTGAPGAGKTYVLNQFIDWAEQEGYTVAITASTGIAASHIGGTTIHSWSGLGIADSLSDEDLARMANTKRLVKRYKRTDVLVIDEVSMLHGKRLDMVDRAARHLRKSGKPFGGLQVILVGDLFQLPPVSRDRDAEFDFVHYSQAWQQLGLKVCYLTEQHRQAGDDPLLDILQAMRQNALTLELRKLLMPRLMAGDDETITRLYSHNIDVDAINQQHLSALPGKVKTFTMTGRGEPYKVTALKRNLLAPEVLELKVGAQVMFVANNFAEGYVNGSRGQVVAIKKGKPTVQLLSGQKIEVGKYKWTMKEDGVEVAEVKQVPLRLAWAITIHKSQGMSLDGAKVDLSKAFMPGMGYVALSRVRSLGGLYLVGLNEVALQLNDDIFEFDSQLMAQSEGAEQ